MGGKGCDLVTKDVTPFKSEEKLFKSRSSSNVGRVHDRPHRSGLDLGLVITPSPRRGDYMRDYQVAQLGECIDDASNL